MLCLLIDNLNMLRSRSKLLQFFITYFASLWLWLKLIGNLLLFLRSVTLILSIIIFLIGVLLATPCNRQNQNDDSKMFKIHKLFIFSVEF